MVEDILIPPNQDPRKRRKAPPQSPAGKLFSLVAGGLPAFDSAFDFWFSGLA